MSAINQILPILVIPPAGFLGRQWLAVLLCGRELETTTKDMTSPTVVSEGKKGVSVFYFN